MGSKVKVNTLQNVFISTKAQKQWKDCCIDFTITHLLDLAPYTVVILLVNYFIHSVPNFLTIKINGQKIENVLASESRSMSCMIVTVLFTHEHATELSYHN